MKKILSIAFVGVAVIATMLTVRHYAIKKWENGIFEETGEKKKEEPFVKGKLASKIYHVPGGAYYERTVPDVLFESEEEALNHGFRPSKK